MRSLATRNPLRGLHFRRRIAASTPRLVIAYHRAGAHQSVRPRAGWRTCLQEDGRREGLGQVDELFISRMAPNGQNPGGQRTASKCRVSSMSCTRASLMGSLAVGRPNDDVLFAGHAGMPSAPADEQLKVPDDRDHASVIAARVRNTARYRAACCSARSA